jgi:hypothetical protein
MERDSVMARERETGGLLAEVTGKPVVMMLNGTMMTASMGTTRLELFPTRLVETTRYTLAERRSEILLSEVQAVEYRVQTNTGLLLLGIILLAACGLGLVLILLYFFHKDRFLTIRTGNYSQMVAIKGDAEPFLDFMQIVLEEAERCKSGRRFPSPLELEPSAPAPIPALPPELRDHVRQGSP